MLAVIFLLESKAPPQAPLRRGVPGPLPQGEGEAFAQFVTIRWLTIFPALRDVIPSPGGEG